MYIRHMHLGILETIGHFIRKQLLRLRSSRASSQNLLLMLLLLLSDLLLHHLLMLVHRLLMIGAPPHPLVVSAAPASWVMLRHFKLTLLFEGDAEFIAHGGQFYTKNHRGASHKNNWRTLSFIPVTCVQTHRNSPKTLSTGHRGTIFGTTHGE